MSKITAISAAMACLLILVTSCGKDDVVSALNKREDSALIKELGAGQLHNEILSVFAEGRNLFMDKMSWEEGSEAFEEAVNTVFDRHGIKFRVDEKFIRAQFLQLDKMRENSGYDFSKVDHDPELAFAYFEKFSKTQGDQMAKCRSGICRGTDIYPDPDYMPADIMYHSEEWWNAYIAYMDEYVASHPELGDWRDWWWKHKKQIRELALLSSDCIGGILFSPTGPVGTLIGAAGASIAFSIAFPPEEG